MSALCSMLLYAADPVGWIALTAEQLSAAQTLARAFLAQDDASKAPSADAAPRKLLNAADAARALEIDPSWLLRAARERRIPFVQIGKYVRFDPQELVALFHVTPTQTGPP